ncbi:MAG: DNRLRE domain-containing protein [Planctomycetota bacterium]
MDGNVRGYNVGCTHSAAFFNRAFCACVAAVIASASTASGEVVDFQQAVNGYIGTVDTFLQQDPANANRNNGGSSAIGWDGDDPSGTGYDEYALVRFDDIIGGSPSQIPPGTTILNATLRLTVFDQGDAGVLHEVLADWDDTDTYSSFCGAGCDEGVEYGSAVAFVAAQIGETAIDVTSSVQRWVDGAINHGWIIVNSSNDGVDARSTETGTVSQRPKLTVEFLGNHSPDQPTLVGPPDGGTQVPAAPTLRVSVTDSDGDAMDVTFLGREGPQEVIADFTLIHLPDTQMYAESYPQVLQAQTAWIVTHRDALNIKYVAQSGDCVNVANQEYQWANVDAAMSLLEDPETTALQDGIPYALTVGNHDEYPMWDPDGTQFYNQWFGVSRFLGRQYYGGHYPAANNDNSFSLFDAGSLGFIVIHFEYDALPDQDVLLWADSLLKTYHHRLGIVVAHYLMEVGDNSPFGPQGQAIYNSLKDNPNLFLMLCGHMHGEGVRTDVFDGRTVYTLIADYQDLGSSGFLRILEFSPANDIIRVKTYSPWLDEFGTDTVRGDDTKSAEFVLPYELDGYVPFTEIGTVTNVASGGNAQVVWPGRTADVSYKWYALASDGSSATASAVWTFSSSGSCAVTADCDDGKFCNGSETCGPASVCQPGIDPCPGQLCDETANLCVDCEDDADCVDSDACNGTERCVGAVCVAGTPVDCSAVDDDCNVGTCAETSGVCYKEATNEGEVCSDGLDCTSGDACAGGICVGVDDCPEGQACNPDTNACETCTPVATYQDGVNGYAGTVDTFLREGAPSSSQGYYDWIEWDGTEGSSGNETLALVRFDGVFGSGGDRVPVGAQIYSAILTLTVRSAGDPGELYEVLVDWSESVTYNGFGGDPGAQADEYGALIAVVPGSVGTHDIDVARSLQAWADAPSSNRGWIIKHVAADGTDVASSEWSILPQRPKLTVTFSGGTGPADPPTVAAVGSRYLAITPPPGKPSVALLVECDAVPCLPRYVDANGYLRDDAVFRTSAQWGTVYVGDTMVIPSTAYRVRADIRLASEAPNFSTPVSATTWMWGDLNNNAEVNVFDIVYVLDAFQDIYAQATPYSADLRADVPNRSVDIFDIVAVLDAFQALGYPGIACPDKRAAPEGSGDQGAMGEVLPKWNGPHSSNPAAFDCIHGLSARRIAGLRASTVRDWRRTGLIGLSEDKRALWQLASASRN